MFSARVKVFVHDRVVLGALALSALLHLAVWFVVLGKSNFAGTVLILHYNIEFGVDLVGQWISLLVLPLIGLLFFLMDLVVAYVTYQRLRLLSYGMMYTAVVIHVVLLVTAVVIRLLNS